jgi:hypothetical protein
MTMMQSKVSDLVDIDMDGFASCKSEGLKYGFEIVTVPATLNFHREKLWGNFFEASAQYVKASERTGLHIHFSRDGVNNKQLAKCLYFMHETVNGKFLTKIAGRTVDSGASWCRQRKKKYNGTTEDIADIINEETGGNRGACSISERNDGKTVEVRIFRSNPTRQGVMQALEFVAAVIEYCGLCGDKESDLTEKAFCNWFELNEKTLSYPYLTINLREQGLACIEPKTLQDVKDIVKRFLSAA